MLDADDADVGDNDMLCSVILLVKLCQLSTVATHLRNSKGDVEAME